MFRQSRQLANGVSIPGLGYSTRQLSGTDAALMVSNALEIGYRLVDVAQEQDNAKEVGKGIRDCGLNREEVFVSVTLRKDLKTPEEAAQALLEMTDALDVGAPDLVAIELPVPADKKLDAHLKDEDIAVYGALEKAYEDGRAHAIGVANFMQEDMDRLLAGCSVAPMVNQVRCGISQTPRALLDWCSDHAIAVMAYSPLVHGHLLKDSEIRKMAQKYNATPAQLCIRYDIQLGTIPVPRAAQEQYLQENLKVSFRISQEDMEVLEAMHRK